MANIAEGFDVRDLVEARALLAELETGEPGATSSKPAARRSRISD
jgi:hypothetical protein